jgi:hypothetical protein
MAHQLAVNMDSDYDDNDYNNDREYNHHYYRVDEHSYQAHSRVTSSGDWRQNLAGTDDWSGTTDSRDGADAILQRVEATLAAARLAQDKRRSNPDLVIPDEEPSGTAAASDSPRWAPHNDCSPPDVPDENDLRLLLNISYDNSCSGSYDSDDSNSVVQKAHQPPSRPLNDPDSPCTRVRTILHTPTTRPESLLATRNPKLISRSQDNALTIPPTQTGLGSEKDSNTPPKTTRRDQPPSNERISSPCNHGDETRPQSPDLPSLTQMSLSESCRRENQIIGTPMRQLPLAPVDTTPLVPSIVHAPNRKPYTTPSDKHVSTPVSSPNSQSRRVRFRNPFPVLKPAQEDYDPNTLSLKHSVPVPDIPTQWLKPKSHLKQLIVAAMGQSLPRRSNACGALKVLLHNNPQNQISLARTDSFLSALVFAASQPVRAEDRDLAMDARRRATACLYSVCERKENRVIALTYPGLLECLVTVAEEDRTEARTAACGALALLTKSNFGREPMVETPKLIDLLADLLGENGVIVEAPNQAVSVEAPESRLEQLSRADEKDDIVQGLCKSDHHQEEANLSESESNREDESTEASEKSETSGSEITRSSSESSQCTDTGAAEDVKLDASRCDRDPLSLASGVDQHGAAAVSRAIDLPEVDSIRHIHEEANDDFSRRTRMNACAVLLHLSKSCPVSIVLSSKPKLLESLRSVSNDNENPLRVKGLEIVSNLTRFLPNNTILAPFPGLVASLVRAAVSKDAGIRIAALRSLQNMSAHPTSKSLLATEPVLNALITCAMLTDVVEKEAAVACLYNITTDPSAVVAITSTKNVVAALLGLAQDPESSSTIRLLACEALATISLWLQTLAGTGTVPPGVPNIPLPTHQTTGWEQWD